MENKPTNNQQEVAFTPEESLRLIHDMIGKARSSFADNSFYFLFWGWLVFACSITQFVLKVYIHYPSHFMVWWLMPLGGVISLIYSSREKKINRSNGFVTDAMGQLWLGIAMGFLALVSINVTTTAWKSAFVYYILLYAIGTFVTGRMMKFTPLVIGGLINFILAIIASRFEYDYQLLMGALAILISYIIPGHLLRNHYRSLK